MNRKDWESQVWASNLSTTARCIALVVATYGNYKDDLEIYASVSTIADRAGVSRQCASDYINAFVEQGWLVPVGKGQKNVTRYVAAVPVAEAYGKLVRTKRASDSGQLSNLTTPKPVQLPKATTTEEIPVAEGDEGSCRREQVQLPKGTTLVAEGDDTNKKNNYKNNKSNSSSTTADAAVLPEDSEVPSSPSLLTATAGSRDAGPATLEESLNTLHGPHEKRYFRRLTDDGATPAQIMEAIRIYKGGKGNGWEVQALTAAEMADIAVDVW